MSTQFDIVGTEIGCLGGSCKEHPICGIQVQEGTLFWLRLVELVCVEVVDDVALAVYLDNDGKDG